MKKINFNKKNILKVYREGMESTIYYYKSNSEIVFLKLFKNQIDFRDYKIERTNDVFDNKRKKIELIYESDYLKDEVEPLELVFDNEKFIGYTIKIDYLKTADDITSRKNKISILKQLKEKIELFNENGIYIGDINPKNILVSNDGKIKLCDLDNFKIDNYDFDLLSLFQQTYRKYISDDRNIDNYCFNMFTISYLERIYTPYVLYNIRKDGLEYPLNSKKNKEILKKLINLDETYKKEYLIDNLRKI